MRKLLPLAIAISLALPTGAHTTNCYFTTPTGQDGCGPNLAGTEKVVNGTHIVTLAVTNAPATAHGLLAIGVEPLSFNFPGTSCYLYLNPLIFVGVNSDANGNASRTFARHQDLVGTALVQAGFEDPKHNQPIETSNALKIDCH